MRGKEQDVIRIMGLEQKVIRIKEEGRE